MADLQAAGEGNGRWAFVIRSELAFDALWRGRLDEAAQRLRELVDGAGVGDARLALTETGRLDEAHQLAIEAAPQLVRTGLWVRFGAGYALLAAKAGRAQDAARMLGAVDAHRKRSGTRPTRNMAQVRERVVTSIAGCAGATQIGAWLGEGASLDGAAFMRLVVEATSSHAFTLQQ